MTPPQLPGLADLTEIGRGGYGVVYRARQERFGRDVAVKVLATRLDEHSAERFARECRALGAVSEHPHIVAVHEAGTTPDGEPYLVMPFCTRGSLADRIRRDGPIPWEEVIDIGVRLAGALQAANDAGVLHRDIKPANILVDSYGSPRLADFGHARHSDSELTHSGAIIATPGYAAPESLRGSPIGPQSDVYSLGATLMALIAGRSPFSHREGENIATVMFRVINDPPADLRELGVPDATCGVLERAVAKEPHERLNSAGALGRALQEVQRESGHAVTDLVLPGSLAESTAATPTVPVPPAARTSPVARRRMNRWLIAAAGVATVAVAAGLFFALRTTDSPSTPDSTRTQAGSEATRGPDGDRDKPRPLGKPADGDPPRDARCSELATAKACLDSDQGTFWVKDQPPGDSDHAAVYWTEKGGPARGECHNLHASKGPWVTCAFPEQLGQRRRTVSFHTAVVDRTTVLERGPTITVPAG
ncbi:MAG: protein kinase [Pseudonocardiaceae bacterium]|nr:protein kinase [Pseudonocardiaceae bacterium]